MPQGPITDLMSTRRDSTPGLAKTRLLIADMDQRMQRQQRRVEKMLVTREGPAKEMQALLKDMGQARNVLMARLESLERDSTGGAR